MNMNVNTCRPRRTRNEPITEAEIRAIIRLVGQGLTLKDALAAGNVSHMSFHNRIHAKPELMELYQTAKRSSVYRASVDAVMDFETFLKEEAPESETTLNPAPEAR